MTPPRGTSIKHERAQATTTSGSRQSSDAESDERRAARKHAVNRQRNPQVLRWHALHDRVDCRDALRVVRAERERAEIVDPPRFPRVIDRPDDDAQPGVA